MSLAPLFLNYEPDDLDVQITELIVATSESADPLTHPRVSAALSLVRERLDMDVVFVSQFAEGRRTFRVVEDVRAAKPLAAGQSDPLEESWCQRVVEERIPRFIPDAAPLIARGDVPDPGMPIGTHMSTPLTLANGNVYGTLCCFSTKVATRARESDMRRLELAARLISDELLSSGVGREMQST
ncbi:GAF domain-containing protein [Ramlibacter sp. MMS24-I3-19]|uniref:GAF domain-containing protein n=1 Tax=Ramlibacter sp. MMS24-I3-19 TaxID=3416606 RepID=UPI003D074AC4